MPGYKILLLVLFLILLAIASLRAIVKVMEPRFAFAPHMGLELNPTMVGLKFQDAVIRSGKFNLHAWFFPGDPSSKFLIFYHGNTGNMSDILDFIKFLKPLKLNILAFDYRGYGRSEGYPTVEGIEMDGVAALEWLHIKRKVPLDRITLWGLSLGGAAALKAASVYPNVSGVIVESSFVSLRRMALEVFPWVPVLFVSDGWNNAKIVERIPTPKLFIHGTHDPLIPFEHSEEMYRRAMEPKRILPIKGAGHSNGYIVGGKKYLEIVGGWINDNSSKP